MNRLFILSIVGKDHNNSFNYIFCNISIKIYKIHAMLIFQEVVHHNPVSYRISTFEMKYRCNVRQMTKLIDYYRDNA